MKRYTRLCSVLLVLSLIVGLCAFSASAAETTTESAKTSNLGAYDYTYDR